MITSYPVPPPPFELGTIRIHVRSTAASAISAELHNQQKYTAMEMNNIFLYHKNVTGNNKLLATIQKKNALLQYAIGTTSIRLDTVRVATEKWLNPVSRYCGRYCRRSAALSTMSTIQAVQSLSVREARRARRCRRSRIRCSENIKNNSKLWSIIHDKLTLPSPSTHQTETTAI
jgi:hypothetical protein